MASGPQGLNTISNSSLHAKNPSSPWDGRQLRGRIVMTFLRGQMIMKDGETTLGPAGRFVPATHRALPSRSQAAPRASDWGRANRVVRIGPRGQRPRCPPVGITAQAKWNESEEEGGRP